MKQRNTYTYFNIIHRFFFYFSYYQVKAWKQKVCSVTIHEPIYEKIKASFVNLESDVQGAGVEQNTLKIIKYVLGKSLERLKSRFIVRHI